MLFTFTFPHFKILISKGPNFFALFKFTWIFDDFAVILSNPIRIACGDFKLVLFFFFSFKFFFVNTDSLLSFDSSKLGFISFKFFELFSDKLFSKSEKQYKLTIYGSGSQFESIANRESLNINVNSFVSRDELLQKTNHIPFALVSLSPKITVEGFPGKTFDYLKMNKILIGFSNSKSSLAKFIEKYKLGINISPNEDNLDSKLQTLEDKEYIDQIYKNISEINNKFANVDAIADQYIKLI